MRRPHPLLGGPVLCGLVLCGALLCAVVAGCGAPPSGSSGPSSGRPSDGGAGHGRVLEVEARLPGGVGPHLGGRDVRDPLSVEGPVRTGEAVSPARRDAAAEPSSITLAFTGDTLVHSPLVRRALSEGGGTTYDFAPMFAAVAPVLTAADLAVCHLETPIAPAGEELSTYPLYGVPAEVVGGLASAGYDRCSTASNHALDRGIAGIDATVAALRAHGITQAGMASSPQEAIPEVLAVGGISLAHLSYTYGFNGLRFPEEEPWRTNPLDPQRIVADARDARARGAQVVIVSLHWGDEGRHHVSDEQRAIAEEITASGAIDLIVGHHAHVIQPIERVNGVWVVFGLGNHLSNLPVSANWPASTQDGVIVQVTVAERDDGGIHVGRPIAIPTWVDKGAGYVIRPVIASLEDPTLPDATREQLFASLLRTREVLLEFIPGM